MNIPFVDLSWQHRVIQDKLKRRFEAIFERASFIGGKDVEEFENNFVRYLGVRHAIGVANGTDALFLSLRALGISSGDEVVTVPTTFVATASAIVHAGATPVFVDIDPETRSVNVSELRAKITPRTKAIIPVHLYGQPVPLDPILEIASENKLFLVEDACQAQGAEYKGKKVGSFGNLGAFSFYPGKNLGAYGDAGAVVTNDDSLAEKVKKLRNHGGIGKYEHDILGYNSRLDALQAAVIDEKLKFLDEWNEMRRAIARLYDEGLKDIPALTLYPPLPDTSPVYHLYVVRVAPRDKDRFIKFLSDRGVATGIHYPEPIHLLPSFAYLGYAKGDFPAAEEYMESIVSLPIFPGMTREQAEYVIDAVHEFFTST